MKILFNLKKKSGFPHGNSYTWYMLYYGILIPHGNCYIITNLLTEIKYNKH